MAVAFSNRITFNDDNAPGNIIKSLHQQQRDNKYTDIQLQCKDLILSCHLSVIAARSKYFEEALYGPEQLCSINLDSIKNPSNLQKIIDYIYSGEIEIDNLSVDDLLRGSTILLINDLKTHCEQYMMGTLDRNNCMEYYSLSHNYGLQKALDKAVEIINQNCPIILQTEAALSLSLTQCKELLNKQAIQKEHADNLLDYCIKWVRHKQDERGCYIFDILSSIKLRLCSQPHLLRINRENRSLFDKESAHLILDVIAQLLADKEVSTQAITSYIVIGGLFTRNREYKVNPRIFISTFEGHTSKCQFPPEDSCLSGSSYCLVNSKTIIITGGELSDIKSNKCKLYDIASNQTVNIASMNHARNLHHCIAVNGNAYVIGGCGDKEGWMDSVECYVQSRWVNKSSMIHGVQFPTATAIDKTMYVIGHIEYDDKTIAQCYNIMSNSWSLIRPPASFTGTAVTVSINNAVFICGGINNNCLRYTSASGKWVALDEPKFLHKWPSVMVYNGLIYLLGGKDQYDNISDVIECYDPMINQWKIMDWKLPIGLFLHYSFILPS